jgi:hypothetical protein
MAQDQRAPGTNIVDVLIVIGISDPGALATDDEGRSASDRLESPDGAVNAAGQILLGFLKEFFRIGKGFHATFLYPDRPE